MTGSDNTRRTADNHSPLTVPTRRVIALGSEKYRGPVLAVLDEEGIDHRLVRTVATCITARDSNLPVEFPLASKEVEDNA